MTITEVTHNAGSPDGTTTDRRLGEGDVVELVEHYEVEASEVMGDPALAAVAGLAIEDVGQVGMARPCLGSAAINQSGIEFGIALHPDPARLDSTPITAQTGSLLHADPQFEFAGTGSGKRSFQIDHERFCLSPGTVGLTGSKHQSKDPVGLPSHFGPPRELVSS